MKTALPLITCICVTRQRPLLLERAIACFRAQSYPEKELLILYETDDMATAESLSFLSGDAIRVMPVTPSSGVHLGALRNLAVANARGAYICQWDDDDWYHPHRLQYQYDLLIKTGYPAAALGHFLMFDTHMAQGYLSCFRSWEGSLLCKKELALDYTYHNLRRGEDTPLIEALQKERQLFTDRAATPLYFYTSHGANTWDPSHFMAFFRISKTLPPEMSEAMACILSGTAGWPEALARLETFFKQTYGTSI